MTMHMFCMTAFLVFSGITGLVAGFGPGGLVGGEQCTSTLGEYCSPESNQCVSPDPSTNIQLLYCGRSSQNSGCPKNCDPNAAKGSKQDVCSGDKSPLNSFCSNITKLCEVPTGFGPGRPIGSPCKSRCLNPGAYCDHFLKSCVVPVEHNAGTPSCTGLGTQGSCENGETCSPLNRLCVKIGLPCSTKNRLYFSWYNKAEDRCGDVDAAPRMPRQIFDANNTKYLVAYIQTTTNSYPTPSDPTHSSPVPNPYLSQSTCNSRGYTKAAGSTVAPWTSQSWMATVCAGCNCVYPDCPDQPNDPGCQQDGFGRNGCPTSGMCSLCGPKFNAPIKINFWKKE